MINLPFLAVVSFGNSQKVVELVSQSKEEAICDLESDGYSVISIERFYG